MNRSTPRNVVIDARPRGPRGPLAEERVLGRPVLSHLVELARELGAGPVSVHARMDEHATFRRLIEPVSVEFATGPPPENAAILRTDRLYDPARLQRAVRRGRDPETAVIWRLDRPSAIDSADEELVRRRAYQPLGRFWSRAPARMLARWLVPTRIRPNALTISSFLLMIIASLVVAMAPRSIPLQLAVSGLLAAALVLDTADGHLARLQGTASEFGRWLDAVLDEAADLFLHAAAAWSLFRETGFVGWLVLGWFYASGKYVFVMAQAVASAKIEESSSMAIASQPALLTRIVRLIGHADIRWHLWILLAAFGRLDVALIVYAAYFPIRVVGIGVKKGVRRG